MKLTDILKEAEAKKAGTPTKVVKPTTSVEPVKTKNTAEPKKLEKPKKAAHLKDKEDTRKTAPSVKDDKKKLKEDEERPYWGSYYDVHSPKAYYMDTDDKNLKKEAGGDEMDANDVPPEEMPDWDSRESEQGTQTPADQAHHLGLSSAGWGTWKDKQGKTVAKTVQGHLTKLEPGEKVKHPQEHPAINPDAKPEPGEPSSWEAKTPAQREKWIQKQDQEKPVVKHPQEYPAITPDMNAQGKKMGTPKLADMVPTAGQKYSAAAQKRQAANADLQMSGHLKDENPEEYNKLKQSYEQAKAEERAAAAELEASNKEQGRNVRIGEPYEPSPEQKALDAKIDKLRGQFHPMFNNSSEVMDILTKELGPEEAYSFAYGEEEDERDMKKDPQALEFWTGIRKNLEQELEHPNTGMASKTRRHQPEEDDDDEGVYDIHGDPSDPEDPEYDGRYDDTDEWGNERGAEDYEQGKSHFGPDEGPNTGLASQVKDNGGSEEYKTLRKAQLTGMKERTPNLKTAEAEYEKAHQAYLDKPNKKSRTIRDAAADNLMNARYLQDLEKDTETSKDTSFRDMLGGAVTAMSDRLKKKPNTRMASERPNSPEKEAELEKTFDEPKKAASSKLKDVVPKSTRPSDVAMDNYQAAKAALRKNFSPENEKAFKSAHDTMMAAREVDITGDAYQAAKAALRKNSSPENEKAFQAAHRAWMAAQVTYNSRGEDSLEAQEEREEEQNKADRIAQYGYDPEIGKPSKEDYFDDDAARDESVKIGETQMSEIKLSDFIPESVKEEYMEEEAPLGSGARFKKVEKSASGADNPAAVAAAAGRKKYGQKKMTALAQKGKRDAKK